jgi:hypothetical protein
LSDFHGRQVRERIDVGVFHRHTQGGVSSLRRPPFGCAHVLPVGGSTDRAPKESSRSPVVVFDGQTYRVAKSAAKRLRTVRITFAPLPIDGIEENPKTASRRAHHAREGKRIVQFSHQGKYIGNVCEGELLRYSAWKALNLPE